MAERLAAGLQASQAPEPAPPAEPAPVATPPSPPEEVVVDESTILMSREEMVRQALLELDEDVEVLEEEPAPARRARSWRPPPQPH